MLNIEKIKKIGDLKFEEPNLSDKILDKIFLWAFPRFIIPNHLTIFRYMTTPFVFSLLLFKHYELALPAFGIVVFSDALDGAMARTRKQITNWGKLHDPLADKLLIASSGAILITRFIDPFLIGIIIILEFLTVVASIHLHDDDQKEIGARLPGKIKMIFQSLGIVLLLVYGVSQIQIILSVSIIILYLSILFSLLNILIYKAL